MAHNEFDHIEDSIRKAFDGFELPVTDADWDAIANALPEEPKKRGGWFFRFFSFSKLKFSALALLIIGGIVGTALYLQNRPVSESGNKTEVSDNKAGNDITEQPVVKEPAIADNTDLNLNNAAGDNTSASRNNATQTQTGRLNSAGNKTSGRNNIFGQNLNNSKVPGNAAGTDNKNKGTSEKPQNPATKIQVVDMPPAMGLRAEYLKANLYTATAYPLKVAAGKTIPPPSSPKLPLYFALNTTFAPGTLSTIGGSKTWEGYQMINGSNKALNIRLEAGVELGTGSTRFTVGAALEGNPATSSKSDSFRIKIADRFLPYYDKNNNLLYMLAVRWRDSVVVINRNPQRVWAELPLGLRRTFDKGNLRISAGVTLNPGILLGSDDRVANPYLYQSGSYWNYQGIQADTTKLVIKGSDFMNRYRLGSGLQLGVEKDFGNAVFGIHAQTRYYFTPVWKSGVPIKENNIQYGVQFRLGLKL